MIGHTDTASLASNISVQLHDMGADVSPETVKTVLDTAQRAVDGTYRFVKEQAIPAATYLVGQLYSMYMGNNELPQTAIGERKIEAAEVKPQLTSAVKPEQKAEDEFFDPEWDGFLDSDYKDALDTLEMPKTPDQSKTEKPAEGVVAASKKSEAVVKQTKTAKKSGPQIGFGSHIPRPIRRKKGMTDAEYMNKVQSNLRTVEDPFKAKKVRKARSFSRLEDLATPKSRSEDKYPSNYQIEVNWKNSLRK